MKIFPVKTNKTKIIDLNRYSTPKIQKLLFIVLFVNLGWEISGLIIKHFNLPTQAHSYDLFISGFLVLAQLCYSCFYIKATIDQTKRTNEYCNSNFIKNNPNYYRLFDLYKKGFIKKDQSIFVAQEYAWTNKSKRNPEPILISGERMLKRFTDLGVEVKTVFIDGSSSIIIIDSVEDANFLKLSLPEKEDISFNTPIDIVESNDLLNGIKDGK